MLYVIQVAVHVITRCQEHLGVCRQVPPYVIVALTVDDLTFLCALHVGFEYPVLIRVKADQEQSRKFSSQSGACHMTLWLASLSRMLND